MTVQNLMQSRLWTMHTRKSMFTDGETGAQVDYLRAVGPGVYVGVGWKQPGTEQAKRFLYFMLVRNCNT